MYLCVILCTLDRLIAVSGLQLIYILLLSVLETVDMDGCSEEEGMFV